MDSLRFGFDFDFEFAFAYAMAEKSMEWWFVLVTFMYVHSTSHDGN